MIKTEEYSNIVLQKQVWSYMRLGMYLEWLIISTKLNARNISQPNWEAPEKSWREAP
jgi:hypothetical protein